MTGTAFKIIKIAVSVLGIGVSIATSIIGERDLKNKVAEEVAKALDNR